MIKLKKKISNFIISLLVLLGGIVVFIPFMYMFSSSMRTPAEAFKQPPAILPERFMIEIRSAVCSDFPYQCNCYGSYDHSTDYYLLYGSLCICKDQVCRQ